MAFRRNKLEQTLSGYASLSLSLSMFIVIFYKHVDYESNWFLIFRKNIMTVYLVLMNIFPYLSCGVARAG